MTTYGIKAVQAGTSVNTAADYQVILDSEWPTLKIAAIINCSVPNPNVAQDSLLYSHNLGYTPPFVAYIDGQSPNTTGQTCIANQLDNIFYTTNSGLYLSGFSTGFTKGFVIIFEYNILNTSFLAPVDNSFPVPQTSTTQYGLEVAKTNFDIDTANPQNLGLTSLDRPMQIQVSGSAAQTTPSQVAIYHGLGYPPVYLIYQLNGNHLQVATANVIATPDVLSFGGIQGPLETFYYLILKDAFVSEMPA